MDILTLTPYLDGNLHHGAITEMMAKSMSRTKGQLTAINSVLEMLSDATSPLTKE